MNDNRPPRRKGIGATLARIARQLAFYRMLPMYRDRPIHDTAKDWDVELEGGYDPNSPGIPEADLSEEERKQALERMASRQRID